MVILPLLKLEHTSYANTGTRIKLKLQNVLQK